MPVEVSFDDYVEDIAENQVLLTAATRLLRLPGVPADVLGALRRIVRLLDGVSVIPVGASVPVIRTDRRNQRYSSALAMASLVLSRSSVEQRAGSVVASGFLVDMWSVFEDFVSEALREAFRPYGGVLVSQYASTLDVEGTVKIAPDLVWLVDGQVRACIDVKYKVRDAQAVPDRRSVPDGGVLPAVWVEGGVARVRRNRQRRFDGRVDEWSDNQAQSGRSRSDRSRVAA